MEVPVFKEKIVEKYIERPTDSSFSMEGSMSPKYQKKMNYFDNKSTKWNDGKYDETKSYKKNDKTLKYREKY